MKTNTRYILIFFCLRIIINLQFTLSVSPNTFHDVIIMCHGCNCCFNTFVTLSRHQSSHPIITGITLDSNDPKESRSTDNDNFLFSSVIAKKHHVNPSTGTAKGSMQCKISKKGNSKWWNLKLQTFKLAMVG